MKAKLILALLAIALILPVIQAKELRISDVDYDDPFTPGVNAEVTVALENTATVNDDHTNIEDIELKAWLIDEDNTRVTDKITRNINILRQGDDEKEVVLNIPIPADAKQSRYTLRIEGKAYWSDHDAADVVSDIGTGYWQGEIEVEQQDYSLKILEMHASASSIQVGNSLLIVTKVLNNGLRDEPSIKVKVSIPALELEKTITVLGGLQQDAEATMYINLEIPANADTGLFDLKITAFSENAQDTVPLKKIDVTPAPKVQEPATASTVTKATANLKAGKGAVLTIKVKNNANVAKTFDLTLGGAADWTSTSRVDPGSASIGAGEQKDVVVYLVPLSTVSGKHTATLYVKEAGSFISSIEIEGNVAAAQDASIGVQISKDMITWIFLGLVAVLAIIAIVLILLKDNGRTGKKAERVYY